MQQTINIIDSIENCNFRAIYDAAKMTKCFNFFVDSETNCLYGTPEEPYKVHVIELPFKVNSNIIFQLASSTVPIDDMEVSSNFKLFQAGADLRYAFIPIDYYQDYIDGNLRMYNEFIWNLKIENFIKSYKALAQPDSLFSMTGFINQVNSIKNIIKFNRNTPKEYFQNIHEDPQIQKINSSKVSDGMFLVTFGDGIYKRTFTLFKGFITATKNDSVDFIMDYDRVESTLGIFIVNHKKNPFKAFTSNPMKNFIYFRFMNLQ